MTTSAADRLPATLRQFLAAHTARDVDVARRAFAPTATVTDEGRTYRGTDEVGEFLSTAGSQYRYTTELVDVRQVDDEHWVATNRLEGDFPGGVAELDYRFTLDDGLVVDLVVAPR